MPMAIEVRVLGLILCALAIQFMLSGLSVMLSGLCGRWVLRGALPARRVSAS